MSRIKEKVQCQKGWRLNVGERTMVGGGVLILVERFQIIGKRVEYLISIKRNNTLSCASPFGSIYDLLGGGGNWEGME